MADIQNLILEHLRTIRADLAAVREDVREIKSRVTNVESGIASVKRDDEHTFGEIADQHVRYDRLAERIERIERIEKRLQLNEG